MLEVCAVCFPRRPCPSGASRKQPRLINSGKLRSHTPRNKIRKYGTAEERKFNFENFEINLCKRI